MSAAEEDLHSLFAMIEASQASGLDFVEPRPQSDEVASDAEISRHNLEGDGLAESLEPSWPYPKIRENIDTRMSVTSEETSLGGSRARSQSVFSGQISLG